MSDASSSAHPISTEKGLPRDGRLLRNVASLDASLDKFSIAAGALERGALPIGIEIGGKLRAARIAQRLTQSELSERTGIVQSAISEIEKGKGTNGPSCATVQRIAAALGLRIDLVPASLGEAAD